MYRKTIRSHSLLYPDERKKQCFKEQLLDMQRK